MSTHYERTVPVMAFELNSQGAGWSGYSGRYSDWLRAGRSGDRIPVGVRFSALVQTGPGVHPASCTMGTGSFPEVKSGRGVTLTPHPSAVGHERVELYLYSPYGPYGLYTASVSVQGCTLPYFLPRSWTLGNMSTVTMVTASDVKLKNYL